MNRSPNRGDAEESVRSRLRTGDPLGHVAAAAEEERALERLSARLATSAVRGAEPTEARPRWLAPLAATAALVATIWVGVRWVEAPARDAVDRSPSAERAAAPRSAGGGVAEPEIRQVQFQTTGGTRVVWVLDPRFAL